MTLLLDGRAVSEKLRARIKEKVESFVRKGFRRPGLAVVLVGDDPASVVYVNNKRKACKKVGIESFFYHLPQDTPEGRLLSLIDELNKDERVDGILVQLPLPEQIDRLKVIEAIDPSKDVDGFHPQNMGLLVAQSEKGFIPCTPLGIDLLLRHYGIEVKGLNAVVVGAGFIVGRPLSLLLLWRNATPTVCHVYTKNLKEHTLKADLLVSATGVPGLIRGDMVKEGAVVVDVGISRVGGKIVGDVVFDEVAPKARAITPVPGGVGPMTVTALLLNTLKAYERHLSSTIKP
ncbi:MAG: bifunctional methylenetetrahydrofolate dehydrogenase/methenyltetrahydrofolate cyclohydrolase FolD [Aquificae bacterium]|nr:bifunctional methylenetetrahydrofolate dehydrogenase/methenyltetrahydrofolate cyclohydrolase FolD [Aquificota bacterium]